MYQLKLNDRTIYEGDAKPLNALFNDLSGLSFAKAKPSSGGWLDKMSARESYQTYLSIKANEYKIKEWSGQLSLIDHEGQLERIHLFATHSAALQAKNSHAS